MAPPISEEELLRLQSQLSQAIRIFAQMGETLNRGLSSAQGAAKQTSESIMAMGSSFYAVNSEINALNNQNRAHTGVLQEQLFTIHQVSASEQDRLRGLGDLTAANKLAKDTEEALAQGRKNLTKESLKQMGSWASALGTGTVTKGLSGMAESGANLSKQFKDTKGAIATLAPVLGKFGLMALRMAGPIAAGIAAGIAAVGAVVDELADRFNEARKMSLAFGGQIAGSATIIGAMTNTLINNRITMSLLNVSAEEFGSTLTNLSKSYAFSTSSATKFGQAQMDYVQNSSNAIINMIGMAKTTGMTSQQIDNLLSSFSLLGQNMGRSSESFLRLAARAKDADISAEDLSQALIHSAPAHVFVTDAVDQTTGALAGFAKSLVTSNAALFDGANKSYIAAKAVHALADAAARMDIPQMLAFGAAMTGMTGSIDSMLVSVAKTDRLKMMGTAFAAIEKNVQPGQQVMAKTIMAQQLFGISDAMTALAVAQGDNKALMRKQVSSAEETALMTKTGGDMKRLAYAQAGTLEKIYSILKGGIAKAAWNTVTLGAFGAAAPADNAAPMVPTMRRVGQSASPDGTQ